MGALGTIRTHGRPEVTDVVHLPFLQLGLNPADVMGVIPEQGHRRWCQGELQPSLGMGTGELPPQEGRTRTQRKEQCCFAAHESQGPEQRFIAADAHVDVDAGCHHPCAVGRLNQAVIRVGWIGSFKP